MSTKGEQDLSSMPFRALEPTRSPTPHTHYGRHHQRIDRAFNSGTLGNPGSSFAYHYDKHGWNTDPDPTIYAQRSAHNAASSRLPVIIFGDPQAVNDTTEGGRPSGD